MRKWLQVMVKMVTAWWRWWVGRANVWNKTEQSKSSRGRSNGDVL